MTKGGVHAQCVSFAGKYVFFLAQIRHLARDETLLNRYTILVNALGLCFCLDTAETVLGLRVVGNSITFKIGLWKN